MILSRITEPAISHLPQIGCDLELLLHRQHTMPKAASKLAASPSTPPGSISKTPVAVHSFSISTTSLPIESTQELQLVAENDFSKISGDNEAILDFRVYQKVQQENDNAQGFDSQLDEVLSAVTDRPTDSMLESLHNMQVEQLNEIKYFLQFYPQETTFWRQQNDYCRLNRLAKGDLRKGGTLAR